MPFYAATCMILFEIIHSIAVINSSSLIIPSAHHPAVLLIQGCSSEIELSVSILPSDHHFALLFTQIGMTWSSVTSSKNVFTGSDSVSDIIPEDNTSIALGILVIDDHFFMFH